MKPILVIQNCRNDGPAQFQVFARAQGLPLRLLRMFAKEPLPSNLEEYSGLCILGSPRSVNDDFAPFRILEDLVQQARRDGVPTIGHCFGGQMLCKAFGGEVTRAAVPEIGWSHLRAHSEQWFGAREFPMFQWHYETFSLPPGAVPLAASVHCTNQAFSLDDIHLGMQFHCEVDEGKIEGWLDGEGLAEIDATPSPGIQRAQEIRRLLPELIGQSKQVAHRIYACWARALRRDEPR